MAELSCMYEDALRGFLTAATAGHGTKRVTDAVRRGLLDDWLGDKEDPATIHVLAVGKAAPEMLWGLGEARVPISGIGVTPRGDSLPAVEGFHWFRGEHPVPGPGSLAAGEAVLKWVDNVPRDAPVLVLLSGGGSACMEVPRGDTAALLRDWQTWLREPLDIVTMNRRRAEASALKGGRLAELFLERTSRIQTWIIADTPPGTEQGSVASGPMDHPGVPHVVLASNDDGVLAAGQSLHMAGWNSYRHGARIQADLEQEVLSFLAALEHLPPDQDVALVAGGEPILAVPAAAPPGGRAQHAALLASKCLAEGASPALFLAAGTDGQDGETAVAGAWTTAVDWSAEAEEALARFDAHRFLDKQDRTIRTGGTGTNINDVWIALRPAVEATPGSA